MNPSTCSVCGTPTRLDHHGGTEFSECPACGYGLLTDLSRRSGYWPEDLAAHAVPDFWIAAKRSYFLSALHLLSGMAPGRRLLDFGGGAGYFSRLALDAGWDAHSFDISREASEVAASRVGADRVSQQIDNLEPGSFHVVTLWCVVAHVVNPHGLIDQVKSLLARDGVFWITTPNYRFQKPYSDLRRKLSRPINFSAEDHVGHFSFEALTELLVRNGFSRPRRHFVGVTETCIATGSNGRLAVAAKRAYNRVAFALARVGLPDYVSELQVTARRSGSET